MYIFSWLTFGVDWCSHWCNYNYITVSCEKQQGWVSGSQKGISDETMPETCQKLSASNFSYGFMYDAINYMAYE